MLKVFLLKLKVLKSGVFQVCTVYKDFTGCALVCLICMIQNYIFLEKWTFIIKKTIKRETPLSAYENKLCNYDMCNYRLLLVSFQLI